MTRIAVLDDYQGVALSYADWTVLPRGAEVQVFRDHLKDPGALARRLQGFEVVCAMRERTAFPRSVLQRLPGLKLLVTTGMSNAAIDVQAATELGIAVSGTGVLGYPTAELTWGLIFALLRNIPAEDRAVREGKWQVSVGIGANGKRLGVIGVGRLGLQVCAVGKALGMDVVAWSQNLTAERAAQHGARLISKDELLRTSDVVTIQTRLSDRTRGLIGARELAMMKPTAYLVNTSRGPIVDEEALADALRAKRIAGAGLDVFDEEPLSPGHPFLSLENVVLTPHLGYVTKETYEQFYQETVEDIRGFLSGEPVRVINPDALKKLRK
ncbi:MAG: D-2-hydroxyacid dehydrogenase family protein [Dehalococcoidia bacterium]|nr:D-2-hydroxyacid dehydrogenase family protein [Dehalococcoidia bacterium]